MIKCMSPVFTPDCIIKLKKFYLAQQALVKELVVAQPLGICRITTYVDPKFGFKNLDLTWENGKDTMRTATILTRDELKETL